MSEARQRRTKCIGAIPLQAVTLSSTVAFNKDAFPNSLRPPANHSFSLPQQARLSCVGRQAQFRLSFACGQKLRSSKSHRAKMDRRFGTLYGAALALITLAFARGACTDVERNVVAPAQYSKWFLRPTGAFIAACFDLQPLLQRRPDQSTAQPLWLIP